MSRPMAISKNQVLSETSAEVESILEKAIPVINRKLANFDPSISCTISINELGFGRVAGNITKRACNELVKIYNEQGWKVQYDSGSQRDPGEYLHFS